MIGGVFEYPAQLVSIFYGLTGSYGLAIMLIAVVVMALITPLTLKSTKGMLEMQRLSPQMRRLQQQYRNDRVKLNEEMMKLYQEHKVSPLSSCLPLAAQMPVFLIMFRILHGLTYKPRGDARAISQAILSAVNPGTTRGRFGFLPRYLETDSELFRSLAGRHEMKSFGLDLSKSAAEMLGQGIGKGLPYAMLVVTLGGLYFLQQRMVAARAALSPTMSPAQQKLMQYLPVAFAVFQIFFLTGLVVYYMAQAVLRIGQQAYITRRFYGGDESLGRQAQRAGEEARELSKSEGGGGGGGLFGQARKELTNARQERVKKKAPEPVEKPAFTSKRVTARKNRPTSNARPSGRPAPMAPRPARPGGSRKKRR